MKTGPARLFIARAALALALCASAFVATGTAGAASLNKRVELVAGKASTVELGQAVSDVLVANPAVVDVGTLRSDRLFLVGKQVGDTNVLAFDGEGNQLADISVHVKVDQSALSSTIGEFFPKENVEVKTVNNNIVLSGRVTTPLVANRVRDLASRFAADGQTVVDLMSVEGEQQVMVQVKVLEARRNVLREYGIETDYQPGNSLARNGGMFNAIGGAGLTALEPFASGSILFDDNNNFGPFRLSLQALERDGLVNTLAEPTLTAISGETAGFLAGGEFPVPTGTTDDGNSITIEFKQFGVSLNFTPTVLSENNISLHLATEVSTLAEDQGVTLVGVDIPGLAVRRAETTVEMASGGSIMLAGLIQSGTSDNLTGLPGLSNVPIIGELFKSKSFQRDESELIIMVTPYLVKPFAAPKAQMASVATPSPVPPAVASPAEPVNAVPARAFEPVYAPQGEARTQGAAVPATPRGRRNQDVTPAALPRPNPDAMPAVPVRQGSQQPVPAPVQSVEVAAVAAPAVAPVAPPPARVAKASPPPPVRAAKASPLSQHLVRNLQATYGAKADAAVQNGPKFGYLVD